MAHMTVGAGGEAVGARSPARSQLAPPAGCSLLHVTAGEGWLMRGCLGPCAVVWISERQTGRAALLANQEHLRGS